jgi:hypothetical protein
LLTGAIADPSVDGERLRAGWGIGWRWAALGGVVNLLVMGLTAELFAATYTT